MDEHNGIFNGTTGCTVTPCVSLVVSITCVHLRLINVEQPEGLFINDIMQEGGEGFALFDTTYKGLSIVFDLV